MDVRGPTRRIIQADNELFFHNHMQAAGRDGLYFKPVVAKLLLENSEQYVACEMAVRNRSIL